MELAEYGGVAGVTLIVTQIVKNYLPDKKYTPLLAIFVGVVLSVVYSSSQGQDVVSGVLEGIMAGLIASGLYDQKKLAEARKLAD